MSFIDQLVKQSIGLYMATLIGTICFVNALSGLYIGFKHTRFTSNIPSLLVISCYGISEILNDVPFMENIMTKIYKFH